jgi:hypothetical protein
MNTDSPYTGSYNFQDRGLESLLSTGYDGAFALQVGTVFPKWMTHTDIVISLLLLFSTTPASLNRACRASI